MPQNPHFTAAPTAGLTEVTLAGVPTDDFTQADADAVTAMLARHGLSEAYAVHQRGDFYLVLSRDVALPLTPDVDDDVMPQVDEGQLMVVLNLYDEPVLLAPDDVVPSAFVVELLEFLLTVVRRDDPAMTMVEHVVSVRRKGFDANFTTDPKWSDYLQLLAL